MILGMIFSTEWNQALSEYYSERLRLEQIARFFFYFFSRIWPINLVYRKPA